VQIEVVASFSLGELTAIGSADDDFDCLSASALTTRVRFVDSTSYRSQSRSSLSRAVQ
jgi:hypothetical protein